MKHTNKKGDKKQKKFPQSNIICYFCSVKNKQETEDGIQGNRD